MEAREQRGLEIAASKRITQGADGWRVPSQNAAGTYYMVSIEEQRCTCPDHETRQVKCKHIFAVEYVVRRETEPDGSEIVTRAMRVTYSQNWPAYNAAQVEEKERFKLLLAALCSTIEQPEQTSGRPRLPLSDMAFAATYKVFSGFSSRRFSSDLRDAEADGLISRVPHFNSVSNYLGSEALTPILKSLIRLSSLPLTAIETVWGAIIPSARRVGDLAPYTSKSVSPGSG